MPHFPFYLQLPSARCFTDKTAYFLLHVEFLITFFDIRLTVDHQRSIVELFWCTVANFKTYVGWKSTFLVRTCEFPEGFEDSFQLF